MEESYSTIHRHSAGISHCWRKHCEKYFYRIRDIVGGRSGTYEKVIEGARLSALKSLRAKSLASKPTLSLALTWLLKTVGGGASMLVVVATGTVVRI